MAGRDGISITLSVRDGGYGDEVGIFCVLGGKVLKWRQCRTEERSYGSTLFLCSYRGRCNLHRRACSVLVLHIDCSRSRGLSSDTSAYLGGGGGNSIFKECSCEVIC